MQCGCEIDLDGNGPSCFKSKNQKARKEHRCCECGRTIMPGETYRYVSGVWDGTPETYNTCAGCLSVRDEFFCSYVYGYVWEAIHELINDVEGQISYAKLANITPDARERLCDAIEEYWEEYELKNPLRVALRLDARMQRMKVVPSGGRYTYRVYEYAQKDWVKARRKDVEKMSNAYVY